MMTVSARSRPGCQWHMHCTAISAPVSCSSTTKTRRSPAGSRLVRGRKFPASVCACDPRSLRRGMNWYLEETSDIKKRLSALGTRCSTPKTLYRAQRVITSAVGEAMNVCAEPRASKEAVGPNADSRTPKSQLFSSANKLGVRRSHHLSFGQFPEYLPELVKPLLPLKPLRGAYCAFGEASTIFGVMDEHHGVVGTIEQHDVCSYRLAFPD